MRPAGDSRFHQVPEMIERDRFLVSLRAFDPLRPRSDQAHLSAKHIPELRQLVESQLSQPTPHARDPRVVLTGIDIVRFSSP